MTQKKDTLTISRLTVGQMAVNCYLVQDPESHEVLIVDPGEDANYIAEQIVKLEGKPTAVVATHGHFDHILGARELQLIFNIPFYIHESDRFLVSRMQETARHFLGRDVLEAPPVIGGTLTDKQNIAVRAHALTVMETPGHTPGSICLYHEKEGVLFVGDTIFAMGGVGRTDFSYSEPLKLAESLKRIFQLPEKTKFLPGHGQATTVGQEYQFHRTV